MELKAMCQRVARNLRRCRPTGSAAAGTGGMARGTARRNFNIGEISASYSRCTTQGTFTSRAAMHAWICMPPSPSATHYSLFTFVSATLTISPAMP